MAASLLAKALLIADSVILGVSPGAVFSTPASPPTTPSAAEALTLALPDSDTVQGRADIDERMTVDVAVDGKGPYRFLIDTGSQSTVLSATLAGSLGLAKGDVVKVISMGGTSDVATAKLDTLAIGLRSYFDLVVPLLEEQHIGADGIVGTDSLQDQRVVLDFKHNTIAIGDAQSVGGSTGYEIVVRARKRAGRLILTDAMIDGVRADVVIDTGASTTIGNLALQRAVRDKLAGQTTLISVTGHELAAGLGVAKSLHIGDVNISNVVIAFADTPAFKELKLQKRPAIFLGMRELRIFKRIAIDFPTRRILFDMPRGS